MKKLLLILLCVPLIGFGQTNDVVELQNEIENTNYRMKKFHKQYFNGVFAYGTGATITIVGLLLPNPAVIIVGAAVSLVGGIVMINSHKWFNKDSVNKKKYISKRIENRKIKIENKKIDLARLLESSSISQEEYEKAILEINKKLQLESLLESSSISQQEYEKAISKINKTID